MRAALLPTPGDPFMLSYWLRNYETWRDQVDELVVLVNGQSDPELLQYADRIVREAGGRCLLLPSRIGHDGALLYLLGNTKADLVVLCEDDAYVRRPSAVGLAFEDIERGWTDIVGSPRHEDYFGQFVDFGEYEPGDLAELRNGLWPAFLFARRSDLLATDQRFGDRAWRVGETIEGWGTVTPEACAFVGIAPDYLHLDTLFGTTFQLRAKGLQTDLIHHVRVYDAKATEEWLAEDPPWFHVTGLSTLDYVLEGREDIPDLDATGGLWTRRMAWWKRTWITSDPNEAPGSGPLPSWNGYITALQAFVMRSGITDAGIAEWEARFDPWVTWPETAKVPA